MGSSNLTEIGFILVGLLRSRPVCPGIYCFVMKEGFLGAIKNKYLKTYL